MTGAPPYNAQSPTQQQGLPSYESPTKSRQYYPNGPNGEQPSQQQYSQHPPQTPPAYPPSSIARSPRFSHASPSMSGQLPPPPLNGAAPPPPASSSQYQGHSTTGNSQLPFPRPFSSSVGPGNGAPPYGPSTPHGHHSSHPDGHSHSPTRESESPYRVRENGPGFANSISREPRPASPPRESVRTE